MHLVALDKRGDRPHPDVVTLGQAIRSERSAAKLTQQSLAGLADLRQPDLSHWESGQRMPGLDDLAAIERALRLRLGTLLVRAGFVELPATPEEVIAEDPRLDPALRDILLDTYRSCIKRSAAAAKVSPKTPKRATS